MPSLSSALLEFCGCSAPLVVDLVLLLIIEFDLALGSCGLRVYSCRIFSTLDSMGHPVGLCTHPFLIHLAVFFSLVVQGFIVTAATVWSLGE